MTRNRSNNRLQWVLWGLVLLWMLVTFLFSAQNADESSQLSGRVIRWLLTHFDSSFLTLSPEEQLLRVGEWSFTVRKLAHFTLYCTLGFLALGAFSVGQRLWVAFGEALCLGAVLAVLDELHQSFVPGRSCELRDVAIDMSGVLLGALALTLILYIVRKRKGIE